MNAKPTALLFLLACSTLLAQESALDIPYRKFVLKNGLTLIVHEDHKAPIVAINAWYHVGSKDEQPGRTGFAHLFEHLMLAGSENHRIRHLEAMEAIGATNYDATTNSDRTNYFVAGDRAKIEKGIRELGWGEVKCLDADGNPK